MKKIFLLFVIILLFQNPLSAEESSTLKAEIKMSNVQVYSENDKFGLKDNENNIIVKPIYKKIIKLGNSSWIIQKKDRFGVIDCKGNYLVYPKYRHADRIFGNCVKLGNDRDYGIYDETGKIIIPPQYSKIDPLFGKMFLTYKDYKYGVSDINGKILLKNEFDDIYMPSPKTMRIQYNGEWFEIERLASNDIILPENAYKMTIDDKDFKITKLISDTGIISGYSVVTATDYTLKIFSSISPAYEDTIDELMLSKGADTVSIFMKLGWLPKFPITYAKNYYINIRTPNNGPLSEVRYNLKKQLYRKSVTKGK